MPRSLAPALALPALLALAGCWGQSAPRGPRDPAPGAVAALQASRFAEAVQQADATLARDPRSSRAAAVRAIATYKIAGHELFQSLRDIVREADKLEFFDHPGGRAAWQGFLTKLEAIDRDLAVAGADPGFSLELCLACWTADWNGNGRIDDRDRALFELEYDGKGGALPEGDPRRRPTFRFDAGDIEWARAMIAFQRAAGELVLAYRWSELDNLLSRDTRKQPLVIRLTDPARIQRARELVIAGLDHADRCREAYLAETDDDREWVPSPRQKSHPMPLEVDDALYRTWAGVTGDLRRMLRSEEGLSLRELDGLAEADAATYVPDAYIDLGRMLSQPKDIVIDVGLLLSGHEPSAADFEQLLRGLLGNGFQPRMKPSPLIGRLRAMKRELDTGGDTLERKLRYLLWLN
jgi:diadenosine tetraphosphatase ApaH/serine/threonine PP2A family protein phosphatase